MIEGEANQGETTEQETQKSAEQKKCFVKPTGSSSSCRPDHPCPHCSRLPQTPPRGLECTAPDVLIVSKKEIVAGWKKVLSRGGIWDTGGTVSH